MSVGLLIGLASMTQGAAVLVGAFGYNSNGTDVANVQSAVIGATRTSGNGNNAGTFGVVAGSLGVFGGGEVGVSTYTGVDTGSFGVGSNFSDMNRFGGANGSLITFDYDLGSYLSSNPAGGSGGEFTYTVEGSYEGRRTGSGAQAGTFYISYNNGGAQTLDTTLVTAIAINGADDLVAVTSNYTSIGAITSGSGSGTFNFDVTSHMAASTDGVIRIAYFDDSFSARIHFRDAAGIVANESVPEPSSTALLGLGGLALILRRKK